MAASWKRDSRHSSTRKVPKTESVSSNGDNMTGRSDTKKPSWATKSPEQVKKIELLREIDQLEKQICAIEREKGTHLYGKRNDFRKDYCTMEEQEMKMVSDRKTEKSRLQNHLTKLRHQVDKFQYELQNVKPTPEFLEKLKELMESIEASLNDFKEQQKTIYEQLMRDELVISQEVAELDKHFDLWSQLPPVTIPEDKPAKKTTIKNGKKSILADMPPEVAAFERFLQQTGGHRGGWDEYDHGTFMRIRNKHKGKVIFMDEAASSLPGRTFTDVKEHEAWYQEYTSLMEKKKEAIQKWRLVKEAKKDELLKQADRHEQDEASTNEKKASARAKKLEDERRERLSQLNAWKVQKELEKAQAEEKKLLENRKQMKRFEQEKQRQLEVKAKLEELRERRAEEEEYLAARAQERLETEREERRRVAQQEVKRFRERDRQKQEEQMIKEKEREAAEQERAKKLKRLKGQDSKKDKRLREHQQKDLYYPFLTELFHHGEQGYPNIHFRCNKNS
ncbi:putative coiled-coil domain-containing protein [Apostichopus japonicus]|uniref:Putative coiled-coil domain-containing protein n=1 Tax=Stichopus japonicus TaxID=307972 RepID=A0A2G8LAM3_STIJA|nr:putative coiled-coil domain-containing protein [Apostichopus japonicus]